VSSYFLGLGLAPADEITAVAAVQKDGGKVSQEGGCATAEPSTAARGTLPRLKKASARPSRSW
jgi:hypothetical protein